MVQETTIQETINLYRNPMYSGEFEQEPFPDRYSALIDFKEILKFTVGIKTVTHDRKGLAIKPTKYIILEMTEGETNLSFELPPSWARGLASKLEEYATAIESQEKN